MNDNSGECEPWKGPAGGGISVKPYCASGDLQLMMSR
jgi:hypothetical protein